MNMKRIFFILSIFFICIFVFFALIFLSSPYRELRPYKFFGENNPEKLGQTTKLINGRKTILISNDDFSESFYIDQLPVTIKDYKDRTISIKNLYEHYKYNYTKFWENPLYGAFPVTYVNWFDAQNYCLSLGGNLPTEYQWKLAAGAASHFDYPWGNSLPNLSRANLDGYYQMLIPAGWLPEGSSPFGVLDMTGNVREWVLDELYEDNDNKLLKGGGDNDSFANGKIEAFFDHGPTSSGFNRGFRCVYPAYQPPAESF